MSKMLRSRRAVSLEDVVTLAVIVACAVIVLYFVFYVPSQEPQVLPRLTVSLTSLSGIAGQSVQLNVSIRNEGGEAPEVSVTLDSEAFGEVTSTPINVPSYQTKSVAIPAKVKDLPNQRYSVTISYSYKDMKESPSNTSAQFYVIPLVEIIDSHWSRPLGWPLIPEKATIGRNDSTMWYFKVHSKSNSSTYVHLSASANVKTPTQGLTITSDTQVIENIGPTGTTHEYSFQIDSKNTPTGKYEITIVIMSDDYMAATSTIELTVSY